MAKYIELKAGDEIKAGDEQLLPGAESWRPVPECVYAFGIPASDPGYPWNVKYRRRASDEKNDSNTAGDAAGDGWWQ